jgi:proteasome alpha subunit
VSDQEGFVAMGGESDTLTDRLREGYRPEVDFPAAVRLGVQVLTSENGEGAEAGRLEVAVLDRSRGRRKFRRLAESEVGRILE